MRTRSNGQISSVVCLSVLTIPLATSAAVVQSISSININAVDESDVFLFTASKREVYSVYLIQQKLSILWNAAVSNYASTHGGFMPDFASALYSEGLINDPRVFYSDGDADPVPTTINNDEPDAANSAQISFSFPGAGLHVDDLSSGAAIFEDNAASNNAGLGKFFVTRGSQFMQFEPAFPRVLSQVANQISQISPGNIFLDGGSTSSPYDFDIPNDAWVESKVGPHRFDLRAEGSVSQEILDVFDAEVAGDRNSVSMQCLGGWESTNTMIIGPSSNSVDVSTFLQADILLRAPTGSLGDVLVIQMGLNALNLSTLDYLFDSRLLSGNQDTGFYPSGLLAIVDREILTSGDPEYVPGLTSVKFRLVGRISVLLNTMDSYRLRVSVNAIRGSIIESNQGPGGFASISAQVHNPVTLDQTQLKLYLPDGYTLSMNDPYGPNDLIVPVLKGDIDLDGTIGPSDQAAFMTAYTRPLGGLGFSPATFDELATFDFDGDGDLDCADHQGLRDAWNAGGSPGAFSLCDNDADGDGIPNGDDGCANTPAGGLTGQTGCLLGDSNLDGVVNAADNGGLVDCMNGPSRLPSPASTNTIAACLNTFDFDSDYDIDLEDFAAVQRLSQ